jgi:hypothetical protein
MIGHSRERGDRRKRAFRDGSARRRHRACAASSELRRHAMLMAAAGRLRGPTDRATRRPRETVGGGSGRAPERARLLGYR